MYIYINTSTVILIKIVGSICTVQVCTNQNKKQVVYETVLVYPKIGGVCVLI